MNIHPVTIEQLKTQELYSFESLGMFMEDVEIPYASTESCMEFSDKMNAAMENLAKEVNQAIKDGATEFTFMFANIRCATNPLGEKAHLWALAHRPEAPQ